MARSYRTGYRGQQCSQRSGNGIGQPSWTRSLAGYSLAAVGARQRTHSPPNRAQCRLLAPDSDGTCRVAGKHPLRLSPAGQGSDFRQNVPCDDPPLGPGATSECQNSSTAGPPARADQVLQRHSDWADPTATSGQPSGRSGGRRSDATSTNLPPQIVSSLHARTCTSNNRARQRPSSFSTLLTSTPLVRTLSPNSPESPP